jgi:hypothetical protein
MQVRFLMGYLGFFIDLILLAHYGPGVHSTSNRNGYQRYLLGIKAAGASGWPPCHLYVCLEILEASTFCIAMGLSRPVFLPNHYFNKHCTFFKDIHFKVHF